MTRIGVSERDEVCWQAVKNRDQDPKDFVYAVLTTGIYCRCGCSSRLPRRENIAFFDSPAEAEMAGYRACLRCRPGKGAAISPHEHLIIEACRTIENSRVPPKLDELALAAGLSPYYFHRVFKKMVGVTPKQYGSSHQKMRFRDSLRSGQSVSESIYEAGYSSSSRVYEKGQDHLAMQPGLFKKGAAGITIQYGLAECYLGWVVVAATQCGICAIELGDDPDNLARQMQANFPKAAFARAGAELALLIKEVISFIERPKGNIHLPLDIQGTAFQRKVWDALRRLKVGETVSYAEVAEQIGNPGAIRAVAKACASNKLAVAIPCHRVIYKSGTLSSYRWGIERKRLLLERERGRG